MIRNATPNDLLEVNKLGLLVNKDYENLFKLDQIINDKYAKFFVYEKDSKVIGFIHVNELDEAIDLINLVVDPAYRRKKIGSLLLKHIIADAKETVKMITLEVSASNKTAQKLYEKFDFEIISIRPNYYNNEDGYLMGRWIK